MANVVEFIIKGTDKFSKSFNKMRSGINKTAKVIAAAVAIAGAAFVVFAKRIIDVGNKTENLRLRMNTLLGSVKAGGEVFNDMSNFAARVPFEYEKILESATTLSGVLKGGRDEINQYMPIIADLAAVSGLSIQQTTEQIVRMYSAGAGAADLFRERGILSMLGFKAGVSVSAEETKRKLIDAFESPTSKFRGASEKLASTWEGTMSLISDKWFQMTQKLGSSGLFDYFKAIANVINDLMGEALKNTGDNFADWTKFIIDGIKSVAGAVGVLGDIFRGLRVVWRGLKVIWAGFVQLILENIKFLTDGIRNFINAFTIFDLGPIESLETSLAGARIETDSLVDSFNELALAKMPSDQVEEFMGRVEIAFRKLREMSTSVIEETKTTVEQTLGLADELFTAIDSKALTWVENLKQNTTEFADQLFNVADTAITGIGDAFGAAIAEGKSLGDSFKGLVKGVLKSIISMFVQMAIKRLILAAITKSAIKAEATSEISKSVAAAGANGVASMAAAPFPLNLGAPAFGAAMAASAAAFAASGAATGAGIGASIVGARADGGFVGGRKTYLVGERGPELFTPGINGNITSNEDLGLGGGSGGAVIENINIHILENATNSEAFFEMDRKDMDDLVAGPIIDALNRLDDAGIRQDSIERLRNT